MLTSYRFNTRVAMELFCSRCRSNSNEYGVNIACLAGVSPFDCAEVPVIDGAYHPSHSGGASRRIGTLRFVTLDQDDT